MLASPSASQSEHPVATTRADRAERDAPRGFPSPSRADGLVRAGGAIVRSPVFGTAPRTTHTAFVAVPAPVLGRRDGKG